MLLAFILVGTVRAEPELRPDYPHVPLRDLHAMSRSGKMGQAVADKRLSAENFVVVGRTCNVAGSDAPSNWILVDSLMACCTIFRIGLPLYGQQALQHNDWIAVYGRLVRVGDAWTQPRLDTDLGLVTLGGDDLGIQIERIEPAHHVVHKNNVVDLLQNPPFTRFREAMDRSGVTDALKLAEAITILAPHDQAFDHPDTGPELDSLTADNLRHFVLGHVTEGRLTKHAMTLQTQVTMMNGETQDVIWHNGRPRIGGARILMANLAGHNGVAHVIMPMLPIGDPKPSLRFFSNMGAGNAYVPDPLYLPEGKDPFE